MSRWRENKIARKSYNEKSSRSLLKTNESSSRSVLARSNRSKTKRTTGTEKDFGSRRRNVETGKGFRKS